MGTVSGVKYWKCPKCGEILEKGALEKGIVRPGQENSIIGTGTCSKCGTGYSQSAIYGGDYDFVGDQPKGKVPTDRVPTVVSIVLFREGRDPPPDGAGYCRRILRTHYGERGPTVRGWQMIGRFDRPAADSAGALYSALVESGQIPDYGHATDAIECEGPDGHHVAALVFWHESTEKAPRKRWRFWK
jgi:hypothetical protein